MKKELAEIKRLKIRLSHLNNQCLKLRIRNDNLNYQIRDGRRVFKLASKYVFMPVHKAVKARFKLIELINAYEERYNG